MKTLPLFLLAFCLCVFNPAFPQDEIDHRKNKCTEFSLGSVFPFFWKQNNLTGSIGDTLKSSGINPKAGFTIGIIRNISIVNTAFFRTGINVSLYRSNFQYDFTTGKKNISSDQLSFEFPFQYVFGFTDLRKLPTTHLYMIAGMRYAYMPTTGSKGGDPYINLNKHNFSIDLGLGSRIYSHNSHLFGMELLYSFGMLNIKGRSQNDIYNNSINRIWISSLRLLINFS